MYIVPIQIKYYLLVNRLSYKSLKHDSQSQNLLNYETKAITETNTTPDGFFPSIYED